MTASMFGAAIIGYFVAFLMLAAAAGKLRTFADFRANLVTSFGLGAQSSTALAPAIVAMELAVALLVLSPYSRAGMLAALLMLACFSALVSYKFFTQAIVRCSCFGEAGRPVSGLDLLRNVLVLASIAGGLYLGGGAGLTLPASILAAALATLMLVVAIEFHDIATLLLRY